MAKITKLVDMAYDDEESYETAMPISMPDKPDYPYGLRICLSEKELKKLGLDSAEAAEGMGGTVRGQFVAKITSASVDVREGDETHSRIELQITEMVIEGDDTKKAEPVAKARSLIYASS